MKTAREIFLSWLPFAAAVTGLCLLTYGVVQQSYRQSLNDPQIQMAEDAAYSLEHGAVPADVVPHNEPMVDIAQSLAPWIVVYDASGTPLESSATLDGKPPVMPHGVFDTSTWRGPIVGHHFVSNGMENRLSWQPRTDVREAIVIVQAGDRFVVAGRNMREVEDREGALGEMVSAALIALLATTWAAVALRECARSRER